MATYSAAPSPEIPDGVRRNLGAVLAAIQSTAMYRSLGFGFLPVRRLVQDAEESGDDIVVVMGHGSVLPIHIHPKKYFGERWMVLAGKGMGYLGRIHHRRLQDADLIRRWNRRQESNVRDGVLEVTQVVSLRPGVQLQIRAGQAHGCCNPFRRPLIFYGWILQSDGRRGRDPTDRRLRGLPSQVSRKTLLEMVSERERKLLSQ